MTLGDDILSLPPPKADARAAYGGDGNQFVDLRVPQGKGPYPLAICIHGGYWRAKYDLGYLGHLCAAITSNRVATANLEYRRIGMRVADGLEPLRIFGRRINSCCRMRGSSGSTRRGLSCSDIPPGLNSRCV